MKQQRTGFTLIELLIVVAIIGILAAIAVPNFLNAQLRAKIAKVEGEFNASKTAFEMYRIDNGSALPDAWSIGGWYAAWQRFTTPVAYLSTVPIDIFQPEQRELYVNGHPYYEFVEEYRENPSTGKNYALASLGPDMEDDTLSFGAYPNSTKFVAYNNTNGLFSDGDILYESKQGLNPTRF